MRKFRDQQLQEATLFQNPFHQFQLRPLGPLPLVAHRVQMSIVRYGQGLVVLRCS